MRRAEGERLSKKSIKLPSDDMDDDREHDERIISALRRTSSSTSFPSMPTVKGTASRNNLSSRGDVIQTHKSSHPFPGSNSNSSHPFPGSNSNSSRLGPRKRDPSGPNEPPPQLKFRQRNERSVDIARRTCPHCKRVFSYAWSVAKHVVVSFNNKADFNHHNTSLFREPHFVQSRPIPKFVQLDMKFARVITCFMCCTIFSFEMSFPIILTLLIYFICITSQNVHDRNGAFHCEKCQFVHPSQEELRKHEKQAHRKCPHCKKIFVYLDRHVDICKMQKNKNKPHSASTKNVNPP